MAVIRLAVQAQGWAVIVDVVAMVAWMGEAVVVKGLEREMVGGPMLAE